MKNWIKSRLLSFGNAFRGIGFVFRKEVNFRIHVAVSVLVIAAGIYFPLTVNEWIVCIFLMVVVISAELFNSSVERLCDLYSKERSDSIRRIKDLAGGAVLVLAIGAAVIGIWIFLPYIIELFNS